MRFLGSIYLLLAFPLIAQADVRVGLFQKELPDHFWVSAASGIHLTNAQTGQPILTVPGNKQVALQKAEGQVRVATADTSVGEWDLVRIEPAQSNDALIVGTERIDSRPYHGALEIRSTPHELLAVNILSETDYLNAVVAAEMPSSWPLEALKAQAVVARTFMEKERGRHRADGYDFCDLAHCQVYQGASKGNSAVHSAVEQTHHEVLRYHGAMIEAFFHSTCGGHTASNEDVWTGPARPYLRGQSDAASVQDYCRASPDYEWTIQLDKTDLGDMLRPAFEGSSDPGTLQSLDILSTDTSGRVKTLRATFTNASVELSGYKLYLLWGRSTRWHQLKSTWFRISSLGDRYEFRGKGLGHGIGLCQWGAHGRADQGADYRNILEHYFTGTTVAE